MRTIAFLAFVTVSMLEYESMVQASDHATTSFLNHKYDAKRTSHAYLSARQCMNLRGGSSFSKWFTEGGGISCFKIPPIFLLTFFVAAGVLLIVETKQTYSYLLSYAISCSRSSCSSPAWFLSPLFFLNSFLSVPSSCCLSAGNEDMFTQDKTEEKVDDSPEIAPAATQNEEKPGKTCEEIVRRAECKANPSCIYDTAKGCYTRPASKVNADEKADHPGAQV